MLHTDEPRSVRAQANDPAERIVQHLLHCPYDLADTRYLMRLFQASAADFQHALARLEEIAAQPPS